MIRTLSALALGLGLAALSAGSASAYVLQRGQFQGDQKWYQVRWPQQTRQVRFVLNDRPLELLPNLASNSTPLEAVETALRSWALAPVGMYFDGTVADTDANDEDDLNLITFADTTVNREELDRTGNAVALTSTWARLDRDAEQWTIRDTDILLNPGERFATDGRAGAYDVQAVLTHELGHALGLDHSPIAAATMYPLVGTGRVTARTLEPDDLAGMQALYRVKDAGRGSVSGKVQTRTGAAVFGAHVVATAADGRVLVGALTERDGSFTLSGLPPGEVRIHAEPLHEPATAGYFGRYYEEANEALRPAFAGGSRVGTSAVVTAGKVSTVAAIRVEPKAPRLNLLFVDWLSANDTFRVQPGAVSIPAGQRADLVIGGDGLDDVTAIGFSGTDIDFDPADVGLYETSGGTLIFIIPLQVRAGAAPGARNIYLESDEEVAVLAGGVRVTGE
jgi:hypothetical protein